MPYYLFVVNIERFFATQALSEELSAFVCSGAHIVQQDCQPSSVHTVVEAMSKCVPPIPLKPPVIKYLGK